jgi:DNA-directed RNA polymerase subunit RPC12/RpoP
VKGVWEHRYIASAGYAIRREAVATPPPPPRAYPMELRCPNCGSTDIRKLSLVYEEGLSRIKGKSRLGGLFFGDDGPNIVVGTSVMSGMTQTGLSKRLRPPKKWSYSKVVSWAVIVAFVGLIVQVHSVMGGSAIVSSVPIVCGGVIGLLIFVAVLFAVWRHNHLVYPRLIVGWETQYTCTRCGAISQQNEPRT